MRKTVLAIALQAAARSGRREPAPRRPGAPAPRPGTLRWAVLRGKAALGTALGTALLALGLIAPAAAQEPPGGRRGTGLPVPRYVSLKTDRVNLREGPSKDHRTLWVYQRAGLPVEIVAEYETWRRIRDSEGTEGWVLHSLLSGRRTALVMPWAKGNVSPIPLLDQPEERGAPLAKLQPGVVTSVKDCTGLWCRVVIVMDGSRDLEGFVRQDKLWGVYPDERVE